MNTEDLLLAKLRAREESAFRSLYALYYADLRSWACHYIWNQEAAEDLVQDVFIKLYESAASIQIQGSLRSYLFSAVRNRCLNYLRDHKVRDTHHQGLIEASLWAGDTTALVDEELLHANWLIDQLQEVIAILPNRCREIVKLRLENKHKFSEIAYLLNISENNAKVQMNLAIKYIRREFDKRNIKLTIS